MVFSCLGPPRPGGQEKSDMGDFLGRSYIARGGDHLQIGEYRLGVYMGQGRLVAIVLVVLVMLAVLVVLVVATMVLVVLARSAIASVVLVVLAWTAIALVVLARTAMMLVEARAMVAMASVVVGAMVDWSAGGVSPIYMVDVGAVLPTDGAVEVVCVAVFAPLSGREVAAYLAVAALPSIGVDVAIAVDAVEVGEVDVEDAVAVARSDIQFGYHLVGNDRGFLPHVGQSLGRGGDDHDEGGYGC